MAQESSLTKESDSELYKLLQIGYVRESLAEYVWRVPLVCIFTAVLSILIVLENNTNKHLFVLCWFSVMLLQVLLLRELLRRRSPLGVNQCLFWLLISGIGWWGLVLFFYSGAYLPTQLLFYLIIVFYGSVALPRLYNHLFLAILLGVGFFIFPHVQNLNVFISFVLFFVLLASRSSAISYLTLVVRAAAETISRKSDVLQLNDASIYVFAWQLARTVESTKALVVTSSGKGKVVEGLDNKESTVEEVFHRGLLQRVDDLGQSAGIIKQSELGEQFNKALKSWFSKVPSGLYFACFRLILDKKEEDVVIFVPVSLCAKLVGINRTFRGFARVMLILRTALEASRTRSVTSDVLFDTQRTISAKEHELNEMVHEINNIVQDLVITCETLRDASLIEKEGSFEDQNHFHQVRGCLDNFERYLNILAARVTDTKLSKELVKLKTMMTFETIQIDALVKDVSVFADYLAERSRKTLDVINKAGPEEGVRVASGAYLKTALRGLLESCCQNKTSSGIEFLIYESNDSVIFEIGDDREATQILNLKEIVSEKNGASRSEQKEHSFIAASNLARVSGGKFDTLKADDGMSFRIALELPISSSGESEVGSAGQWALLVDDSPEAVTFYSRIAQALNLNYFTAGSVKEAEEILEDQGEPKVVVTDLQLQESSGLDLLKSLRQKFGPDLPVIVVSGNIDESVIAKVRETGTATIIGKPVGRRRLFSEIKSILAGQDNK